MSSRTQTSAADAALPPSDARQAQEQIDELLRAVSQIILGKEDTVRLAIACLLPLLTAFTAPSLGSPAAPDTPPAAQADYRPALWSVEHQGRRSWLFGALPWSEAGVTALPGPVQQALTESDQLASELRMPVIEEQLRVGKRQVDKGGVRVIRRVQDRPAFSPARGTAALVPLARPMHQGAGPAKRHRGR